MNVVFLSVDTSMFSYSFKSRILTVEIYIFTVSICFALNAVSILAVIGNLVILESKHLLLCVLQIVFCLVSGTGYLY